MSGKPEMVNGLLKAYPVYPYVYLGEEQCEGEVCLIDDVRITTGGIYTTIAGKTVDTTGGENQCYPCYINPKEIVSVEDDVDYRGELCEVLMNSGERYFLPYWWEDTDEISDN